MVRSSNMFRRARAARFVRSMMLSVSVVAFMAGSAQAEAGGLAPQKLTFDIPAQNLESALVVFADQAKIQLAVPPSMVRGLKTSGILGAHSPAEALVHLLGATGLGYDVTGANTVTLHRIAQAAPRTAEPVNSPVDKEAQQDEIAEILVTAKRRASTATKFELSVVDTPQSIKAVTSDVLEFARVRTFVDLEKIDASTSSKGSGYGTNITFRGFDFNPEEGLKSEGNSFLPAFPTDFFAFDRIEILKGPSSSVYGQNAVGGMVNAVLKRPLSTFGGSVGAQIGSWDFHRIEGDVGGPLTQDGKLSFRAVAAYENGGDFIDDGTNESELVYGALKYDFDEATSATIMVEYQRRDYSLHRGIVLFADTLTVPDIPASFNFGAPWAYSKGEYLHTQAEISHKFANSWLLKFNGQYGKATDYGNGSGPFGLLNANGDLVNLQGNPAYISNYFRDVDNNQWSGEVSLTGDFDLFGQSHTFYAGVNHRINNNSFHQLGIALGSMNVFNPDYSVLYPPRLSPIDYTSGYSSYLSDSKREFWGGSLQLLLHPADRLSVLLGARWDKSKITTLNGSGEAVGNDIVRVGDPWFDNVLETTKLVPSVGATFELQPGLNLYANYGKSFVPQSGNTFDGRLIAPEEGYQFEGGIKGNFGQMTATLAVFDMTRTHISGIDPDHPSFSLEIGTQRSKGVEVDVFGNILPGWSVYGSFAYVDAKITASDNPADIGARLFNAPKYALSLYTDYQFQKGPLTGLGFGGGVVTKQDRVWGLPSIGFIGRQINPGGYTTVDLRVFYEIGNIMFDLKANNVLDEKYYNTSAPGLRTAIHPGRPREFVGSVKYKF